MAAQFTQELSSEAPVVVRYLPALHSTQALATVAPVVVRYVPAPHSTHSASPVTILYFPSAHAVQLPPFGPVYPGLHRQLVESVALQTVQLSFDVAPVFVRYLPALQSRHEAEPIKSLYFPIPQAVHVPSFTPVYPRLH